MSDYLHRLFPDKSPSEIREFHDRMNTPLDEAFSPDVVNAIRAATWPERKRDYLTPITQQPSEVIERSFVQLDEAIAHGQAPCQHEPTTLRELPEGVASLWAKGKQQDIDNGAPGE